MRHIALFAALSAAVMFGSHALAEGAKPTRGTDDAITVRPGDSPTEGVGSKVPEMNQSQSNKDMNTATEHPPTNRVEKALPPMKAGDRSKALQKQETSD